MPTYRVTFRGTATADQLINAHSLTETNTSYQFFAEDGAAVAQIPRDVVLVVLLEEQAKAK